MPIHNWTRVDAGIFHHFHSAWITHLAEALNAGILPPDYYALGEQTARPFGPDVLTLHAPSGRRRKSPKLPGVLAVAEAPPKARLVLPPDAAAYLRKRRTLVIRHVSGHRIVALIEVLSPGNKSSGNAFQAFLEKAASTLNQGIHLLLVDLFPPSRRDPQGVHGAMWEELYDQPYKRPAKKALTLAAYTGGVAPTAYLVPVAVGDRLPDMPLFLDPEQYINVPLEATYQAAYAGVPRYYRDILEA